MLRFLHTSDWQLGAGFGQIPGDNGARLREERLAAVARIGALAHRHDAQFILLAGDMFDAHTVDNEVVTRALDTIKHFKLPVYAIPGNHDFAGAVESVYKRDRFRERCPNNFTVLSEPQTFSLANFNLDLFPYPLVQRHTISDPTRWLVDATKDDVRRCGGDERRRAIGGRLTAKQIAHYHHNAPDRPQTNGGGFHLEVLPRRLKKKRQKPTIAAVRIPPEICAGRL